jgi:hypothetical protein
LDIIGPRTRWHDAIEAVKPSSPVGRGTGGLAQPMRQRWPRLIGSTIEGSSFSGLLTRVEIGHIRMGSGGARFDPDAIDQTIDITFDNLLLSEPIRRCRRTSRDSSPPPKARSHDWRKSVPIITPQFFLCRPRVGCGKAAIRSLLGDKRTSLGHRRFVALDPTRPLAARLRCTAAAPRTLAWPV